MASRLMRETSDLNGILLRAPWTALGIMEYLGDRPVLIATVDAQEDALDAVKKGKIGLWLISRVMKSAMRRYAIS